MAIRPLNDLFVHPPNGPAGTLTTLRLVPGLAPAGPGEPLSDALAVDGDADP